MTFPLDDILLGPAAFDRLHRLDMVIGHTGEEPGFTRAYAVATARWQLTNPGSYNFRIYDRASDPRGVMLNVPYLEASGGINPSSSFWAPERYPWLREALAASGPCPVAGCPGPYRNPTMHAGQISFVGRRADLDAGKAPANYLPDARALIAWYERHPLRGPARLVVLMHGHLQSNRSDWGTWMQSQLTAEEDDVNLSTFVPIVNRHATISEGAAARSRPAFNPAHYNDGLIAVERAARRRIAIGWVQGTNLTLGDGTVFDARTRWVITDSDSHGLIFYHERDLSMLVPIELLDDPALSAALDAANTRAAAVKTSAAASLRKGAAANRDVAAGLEVAAKNLEGM